MANAEYLTNFSYIFIPFCLEKEEQFSDFSLALNESGIWAPIDDEVRYLHRYVADRLIHGEDGKANLRHFRLSEAPAGLPRSIPYRRKYKTAPKNFRGQKGLTFDFSIADVQLFSFNTSVGILTFRLEFESNDPFEIAAAQYYLRKISSERFYTVDEDGSELSRNFIELSKLLLGELTERFSLDFFFYAAPKNERANFFTYVDCPKKDSVVEELFFLKWCYHDGFIFESESEESDAVNYDADENKRWGISPSAAVCIVHRCEENRDFIENVFQKNFHRQYLLTYILLLHQKYMMYLFLTKMSVGIENDLALLERYKRRLYEFETKYMFSKISEVPQYQRFYEKIRHSFSLKEMFSDVQEPLSRLAEIQKQAEDERQKENEGRINSTLTVLSLLTIISAVTDALGITANIPWLPENVTTVLPIVLAAGVLALGGWLIVRLLLLKFKR